MLQNHVKTASKKAQNALNEITIADLIKHKRQHTFHPLAAFDEETTIANILNKLKNSSFLSAPIYRTLDDGSRLYTGIVSVEDIVQKAIFEQIFDSQEEFDLDNFFDFLEKMNPEEFFATPVKFLIGVTDESANPWIFYSSESILPLLKLFTTQHRALIIDEKVLERSATTPISASASLSLVSQTDLVRFLYSSKLGETKLAPECLEPIFDLAVSSLPSLGGTKKIMAMLHEHSALHGFRTMFIDNIQAVPVVNRQGQIVANLSASDMRGISVDNLKTLSLPVFEFLESIGRGVNQLVSVDQVATLSPDATIERAVAKLLKLKLHRLWVCEDDSETLSGVVSMTDILRLLTL